MRPLVDVQGKGEGMKEEWIAYVLKQTLQGLKYFHDQGQVGVRNGCNYQSLLSVLSVWLRRTRTTIRRGSSARTCLRVDQPFL